MGTLVLDRRNLTLRQEGAAASLYEAGVRRGSVPLKLIDRLIVHGGSISLEAGVLGRLAEQGATGVFLSGRHARHVALLVGPSRGDLAVRLAQARAVTDQAQVDAWALRVVAAKLRHQRRMLRAALAECPARRKPLVDGLRRLDDALAGLAPASGGRAVGPDVASLRGIEGAAAAGYFGAYAALFAESLGMTGRNRRPPRDPVNACLSLAYTLAHSQAVRACHVAGLDPLLGLYHRPCAGRASLACDLIEPIRTRCDEWVWRLLRERELRAEHFWRDGPACLLGKAGRGRFYAAWAKNAQRPIDRWLGAACRALARHWRDEGLRLLPELTDDEADDSGDPIDAEDGLDALDEADSDAPEDPR